MTSERMVLLALVLAGAALALPPSQAVAVRQVPPPDPDYCEVFVATMRHRRSEFPKTITSWTKARAKFEPLGYEILRKDRLALALDRAILTSRPEIARVRLLSFLVAHQRQETSVADLPDDLRETMVDVITRIRPDGETRASALANTVTVQIAAPLRLKFPAGMGADRRIESYPPPKALSSLARLPAVEGVARSSSVTANEIPSAEFRLFRPGRWVQGNVLTDWDAFRPLVKEREDAAVKRAEEELRAVNDEATRWLEDELGVRKGENVNYSLLSPEAKAKVQKLSGKTDDDLVGTQVRVLPGTPMVQYFSKSFGSTWIELKLIAR